MQPQVSVIIPVYNDARNLRICLDGLRGSVKTPVKCIAVDDGWTDSSADVAREFGANILSKGGSRGPALARNIGAQAEIDDVLLLIDADVCDYPDYSMEKLRKWTGVWVGGYSLLAAILVWVSFPWKPMVFLLFLLLALIALNQQFYVLFGGQTRNALRDSGDPVPFALFRLLRGCFPARVHAIPGLRIFGFSRSRDRAPLKKPASNDAAA